MEVLDSFLCFLVGRLGDGEVDRRRRSESGEVAGVSE